MPEITQKLGFDAAGAIATLASLNSAIRKVNNSIRAMNKAAAGGGLNNATQAMANFDRAAAKAGKSVKTVGDATAAAGKKGAKAGQSMTISWQTFGRVLATQAIVRGLNAITSAISEAADAQAEFDLRTAQIANITDEGAASFDNLQQSISGLSVELGRPIGEVTEASMEALQNSLGTTAETFDLLKTSANDLALVTNSTLGQSINAISSVIKAYNLDISESADVSDIFFTAIDKGRITMTEFESRLGTITPLANTLGIGFDDAASSIASLTLSGLNGSIAMTQFRNVLNKLVDPSDDLQAAMQKLGVQTGEELVEKFGSLQKALVALKGTVDGDEQALAKMFDTIRGKLGVLNLFANDGKNINDVLASMQDRLNKTAEGADAIDATKTRVMQKATEELNASLRILGDEFNTLKLGATIFANETIKGLGIIKDNIQPVIDAYQALRDIISGSGSAEQAGIEAAEEAGRRKVEIATESAAEIERINQEAADQTFNSQKIGDEGLRNFAKQEIEIRKQAQIEVEKLRLKEAELGAQRVANQKFLEGAAESARQNARVEDPGLLGPSPGEMQAERAEAEAFSERMRNLATQINSADAENLKVLKEKLTTEAQAVEKQREAGQIGGEELQATNAQLLAVDNLITTRTAELEVIKQIPAEVKKVTDATEFLNKVTNKAAVDLGTKVPEGAQKASDSIKEIKNPFIDNTQALNALKAIEDQAIATANAVARAGAGGGATAYHGGTPVYRNHGGAARGGDTVPAMLSRGEHVTNSRQAANFAPQLQAINSGQRIPYREQGGSVTVGDVNVNVTGGSGSESPDVLGRSIANSLRRELRRKTSAL